MSSKKPQRFKVLINGRASPRRVSVGGDPTTISFEVANCDPRDTCDICLSRIERMKKMSTKLGLPHSLEKVRGVIMFRTTLTPTQAEQPLLLLSRLLGEVVVPA